MRRQRLTRGEAKESTRRHLLRAANRLFLRQGFTATTLAEIADEAGMTKGAVYSNFAGKEELFLTVLREPLTSTEIYAPSEVDTGAPTEASTGQERARRFGRYAAGMRPSRRHVALFIEANAVALRSDPARAQVTPGTRAFMTGLGERLKEAFGTPDADAFRLGLLAQSLYVGLLMHGAFLDEVDDDTFATLYETLHTAARTGQAAATAAAPAGSG
ncbi:MAG TPA: TetR/AcrR family transcriptional regulator [Acidimicrobiales bacterium]|nr:TetR/AcrR family transcriptional regulator [Acidimicrobiales bacterium]